MDRYPIGMGSGNNTGLDLNSPFMQGNYNQNTAQNNTFGYSATPNYGFDSSPFGNMMRGLEGPQTGGFMDGQFGGNQNGGFNLADVSPAQQEMYQFDTNAMTNGPDATGPTGMQKWFTGYTDPKTGNQTAGLASTFGNLAMGGLSAWNGMQMLGLAKDRFKYQKGFAEREYADRKASYEEQLADRASARNAAKGGARRPAN